VVEVGCGRLGGFVPLLSSRGYQAIGVDPVAPNGAEYRRVEFERAEFADEVEAVIASASLHHVAEPSEVLDRVAGMLSAAGRVIVVEWAWEEFDDPTAEWCFQRLGSDGEASWLHRRREEWLASGRPWSDYLRDWARREQLHDAETLVRLLDERFDRVELARGPYFFPALADTTAAEEQAAIEAGQIRAARVDYVGRPF
jgi:SAM-dependent methyltransferase